MKIIVFILGFIVGFQSIFLYDLYKSKNNYSFMLATCLNGGTLYDVTSGWIIHCSKPITWQFIPTKDLVNE